MDWQQIVLKVVFIGKCAHVLLMIYYSTETNQTLKKIELWNMMKLVYMQDKKLNTVFVISELPEDIGELTHLEVFSFSGNCLTKLPASFTKLVNLTELILCKYTT